MTNVVYLQSLWPTKPNTIHKPHIYLLVLFYPILSTSRLRAGQHSLNSKNKIIILYKNLKTVKSAKKDPNLFRDGVQELWWDNGWL